MRASDLCAHSVFPEFASIPFANVIRLRHSDYLFIAMTQACMKLFGIIAMNSPRRPITIASHIIWTNYGTWLPNDPRGSTSSHVFSNELFEFGEPHFGRKRVQPKPQVVKEFYQDAEQFLKFPVIRFDTIQIAHIADSIGQLIQKRGYTCYACTVMPDHVHILIRKHRDDAWDMLDDIQFETRQRFLEKYSDYNNEHPLWTHGGYVNFVAIAEVVHRVIKYIADNPLKIGLPAQSWPFVKKYDNWPNHK